MNVKKTSKLITIIIIIFLSLSFFACGANFEYDTDTALTKAKQAANCLNNGNYKALYNLMDKELQKNMDVDNISSNFTNFIKINEQAGKFIKYNEDEEITGLIKNETKYIKVKFTAQCEKSKIGYEIMFNTNMNIVYISYGTVDDRRYVKLENFVYIGLSGLSGVPTPDFDIDATVKKAKEVTDKINVQDFNAIYKMVDENIQNNTAQEQVIPAFERIASKTGKFINYNDDVKYQDFKYKGNKYMSVYYSGQCEKTNAIYEVIFDNNMNIVSVAYGAVVDQSNNNEKVEFVSIHGKGIKYFLK